MPVLVGSPGSKERDVTSYSAARGEVDPTFAGGVILAILATLSTILVIAGLVYAVGTPARHQRALAAAGCEPNLSPNGLQCTTIWMLEKRYTAFTTADLGAVNTDVAAYNASEFQNLTAAELALTSEVAAARALGAKLAQFPFPPAVAPRANAVIQAILASMKVLIQQARSTSLAQLRSFNAQNDADGVVIQKDFQLLHTALYTRPTAAQEPIGGSCGGVCPGQGEPGNAP
jgi:hypothetical protein